jgi:hypothetical protein
MEGLGKLKKSTSSGTRTGDLPQPTTPQLQEQGQTGSISVAIPHELVVTVSGNTRKTLRGMEYWWNEDSKVELRYREKAFPVTSLFATNTTLIVRKLKTVLR